MYRFYSADADFTKSPITIRDRDEIHHIKDVLRLKKGAKIQIFNAKSQEADVILERVGEADIVVSVKAFKQKSTQGAKIILACAPPKKGKFELIIEKATELGVDEIIPLRTKRGEVVFEEDRMASKRSRFEAVAVNAAKQSKRSDVPTVSSMLSLEEVLKNLDPQGIALLPSLHGHALHIRDVLLKADRLKPVTILIGPEGDFTPDEVALAERHGCKLVSLGQSVLKVETAAIASVALIRFLCQD